jgi:hypothetical protein
VQVASGVTLIRALTVMASSATAGNNCVSDGKALFWAGTTKNGIIGVADPNNSNAVVVAVPKSVSTGPEAIVDIFVNNSGITTGRLFILTDHGNLYGCGDNTSGAATGGYANVGTANSTVGISRIQLP